jgi:hypothetical protein
MYLYFKLINAVVTCEEYPQIVSVETMKSPGFENKCNKWEKNENKDGTFTLSYKSEKHACNCDNSVYIHLPDFDQYECYFCGIHKSQYDTFYLQNSGHQDIVCAKPINRFCDLIVCEGRPNIYKWAQGAQNLEFILHVSEDHRLSDGQEFSCQYSHMEFMETI